MKNLIVVVALLLAACASQPPASPARTPANAPPKAVVVPPATTETPVVELPPAKSEKGRIVGRPAEGSKFSKLKLGMTPQEVEALIGPPARKWNRGGYKHADSDRKAMRYSYAREGVLTFTGEEGGQTLTRILVNRVE